MATQGIASTNSKNLNTWLYFTVPIFLLLAFSTTFFMALATVAFYLLTVGLIYRRDRQRHVLLMNTGIGIDFSLVLALEISRNAVNTVIQMKLSHLQMAHVGMSTMATILYIPTLYLGWQLAKGKEQNRLLHKRIALSAYAFRTLGFLFMFSLLFKK